MDLAAHMLSKHHAELGLGAHAEVIHHAWLRVRNFRRALRPQRR